MFAKSTLKIDCAEGFTSKGASSYFFNSFLQRIAKMGQALNKLAGDIAEKVIISLLYSRYFMLARLLEMLRILYQYH